MIIPVFILFLLVLFFAVCPLKKTVSYNILYVCIAIVLILVATFRNGDLLPDYSTYIDFYNRIVGGSDVDVDVTFNLFSRLSYYLTDGPYFMFFLYAVLGVTLKMVAIRRYTELVYLSLLMYIAFFFSLHELIQIRAGVATGALLLSIKYIYDRDLLKFLITVILASTFHFSAVLMLPLWFLVSKKRRGISYFWYWILPVIYVVTLMGVNIGNIMSLFTVINNADSKINAYIYATQTQSEVVVNIFNIPHLFRCALAYVILIKSDFISNYNKYVNLLIKIYITGLVSFVFLSTVPVVAFRIYEFYSTVEILLLPLIIYLFRGYLSQRVIAVMICSVFLFFLLYLGIIV